MRKRLLIATFSAVLVVAPSGSAAGGTPQVAGLQVALRAQGLYHGSIDAIRGPLTIQAVRDFQRAHRLPVTGHAGRRTREALGVLGRPRYGTRLMERGEAGWDVAVLQFLLGRRGIGVPVNGHFDAATLRGVLLLQRRRHLARDGVVGPATRRALARSRTHSHVRHATHRRNGFHVVRPGDTLTALASRYGTTVARLARLNHLDPSRYLLVGTRLRVPGVSHRAGARIPARTMSIASVRALLDHWSAHYGVNSHLVRGLAWMESGYNNRLVSSTGARGIMQIEPYTWQFVETVLIGGHVRHDPSGNIHIGVAYLHHLLGDFHGDTRKALAGWYQGEGAVRKHGMYKETRLFVKDVLELAARM